MTERHKSTLALALQNDQGRLSAAIYRSVREANETLQLVKRRQGQQERREEEEVKQQILRWLSPIEHALGHAGSGGAPPEPPETGPEHQGRRGSNTTMVGCRGIWQIPRRGG